MILHIWIQYVPEDSSAQQRISTAAATWRSQLWRETPIRYDQLPRIFTDTAGAVPYARDIFDFGCKAAEETDIVCFTDTDLCLRSNCSLIIASNMQETPACYCLRREFSHDFFSPKPDAEIETGQDLGATDLFAFRPAWWRANREKMPDMLIARQSWDPILRMIMDSTTPPGAACLHNLTYHRLHESVWLKPQNRYASASQQYNIRLGVDWCRKYGVDGRAWQLP